MNFFTERFGSNGFLNEHLALGHFGHFFIVLSFAASVLAMVAFFAAEFARDENKERSWRKLARVSFGTHAASVLGIFVCLFLMILNHRFEYHYAWRHSSTELPMKYIISSFWEGQEGSFLLWQFWIAVLGMVGIFVLKKYETGVMGVVSLTQIFLGSMVLGIYFFGYKVGSNPFVLLRDEMANAPIFQRPEYLSFIQDGNGLNPLLQNYWMTIHPPVLFLGFASALFPFAFAIASLLRKDWDGWLKPALPWTLFNIAILGTGILMGGAWAYESLSFGGFWAWDPVENMSFVPWLLIVAGMHTALVYQSTKHSLVSTYVFFLLGFIMVLYSTFLTRSGILGDTSVHAFTDLGMTGQLLLYLFFFVIVGFALLFIRLSSIPGMKQEEELWSREFWMFIGSLILLLSALQMTFTTSIPVWNRIFFEWWGVLKTKMAPPEDVIGHYNRFQILLGILIAIGTGLIQFFSYKIGRVARTARWALFSAAAAIVVAVVVSLVMHIDFLQYYEFARLNPKWKFVMRFVNAEFLFLTAALFAVFGNLAYLFAVLKGKLKVGGGSIAHLGFGIFLVGVLISQGKKEVISQNKSGVSIGTVHENMENILLLRDSTLRMGDYLVTYKETREDKPNTQYIIDYLRKDSATGKELERFELRPNAQLNPKMGLLANPDTKHYWTKDVFTHVSSVPNNKDLRDTTSLVEIAQGDSFFNRNALVMFEALTPQPALPAGYDANGKLLVGIQLRLLTETQNKFSAQPVFVIDLKNGNSISSIPAQVEQLGLTFDVEKIDPVSKKVTLRMREQEKPSDFIIMKAIIFPYINLVWLGGILCFFGALMSMWRRRNQ